VWIARIPPVGGRDRREHVSSCLSPGEIEACAAFRRPQDRVRAEVARVHLRETLSRYAPLRPEAWEFVLGEHGKPALANSEGARLCFNLSHAQDLVACAVTLDHEIGVDLEDTNREVEFSELAQRVFSPGELAAFGELAPNERATRFFEHWTLKEAYLKARGLGFALDPRNASFEFGEAGRLRARLGSAAGESAQGWWFALLEFDPAHTLALAARNAGRDPLVRMFLARPGENEAQELEARIRACSNRS
jgi:4'-phosphopantetheinyl transferase